MRSISVGGKLDIEEIENVFRSQIGEIEYSKSYKSQGVEVSIITGTRFFLRTDDYVGFCLLRYYDGTGTKMDLGRVGGGSGLLGVRLGAGNKVEEKILNEIRSLAESQGYLVSDDDPSSTA